ncbi:hypothetical protein B566_EDAN008652 [Ephemera danica]|nr:hypothetical protein B566_EDAN008652 [Ephemera danica]
MASVLPPAPPAHASATGIMVMGAAAAEPDGAAPAAPSNAHSVVYTDADGQLLDTLPVCQDFSRHHCKRPACKFVHLIESHVEVLDNRVTVCRDAARGRCSRALCKYYHLPVELPPAPQMARLHSLNNNNNVCSTTQSATSTVVPNTSPIHTSSASSSINQDKNTTWPVDNMPQYIH